MNLRTPPEWGRLFQALVIWEFGVYWCLQSCVRVVNRVVPFSKRHLVRCLLAVYLVGEVGDFVTVRQSALVLLSPLIVAAACLQDRPDASGGTVLTMGLGLWRLGWFLFCLLCGTILGLLHRPWEAMAQFDFAILQYALVMPGGPPKQRRRLLDALEEAVERPGYSTACSRAVV